MVCFCISEDGKIVERIYKLPYKIVRNKTGMCITKYNSVGDLHMFGWYEKYEVTDKDELRKANEIWSDINERSKTQTSTE
jgi:hypothetical protein